MSKHGDDNKGKKKVRFGDNVIIKEFNKSSPASQVNEKINEVDIPTQIEELDMMKKQYENLREFLTQEINDPKYSLEAKCKLLFNNETLVEMGEEHKEFRKHLQQTIIYDCTSNIRPADKLLDALKTYEKVLNASDLDDNTKKQIREELINDIVKISAHPRFNVNSKDPNVQEIVKLVDQEMKNKMKEYDICNKAFLEVVEQLLNENSQQKNEEPILTNFTVSSENMMQMIDDHLRNKYQSLGWDDLKYENYKDDFQSAVDRFIDRYNKLKLDKFVEMSPEDKGKFMKLCRQDVESSKNTKMAVVGVTAVLLAVAVIGIGTAAAVGAAAVVTPAVAGGVAAAAVAAAAASFSVGATGAFIVNKQQNLGEELLKKYNTLTETELQTEVPKTELQTKVPNKSLENKLEALHKDLLRDITKAEISDARKAKQTELKNPSKKSGVERS